MSRISFWTLDQCALALLFAAASTYRRWAASRPRQDRFTPIADYIVPI
jgi:hypothetical protein